MNRIVIILFIAIYSTIQATEFAPTGAKWHYTRHTVNPNYITFGTIESIGDTLIGGKTCQKLIENASRTSTQYVYSADDSVFVYQNGKFNLLYDFGAEEGDTVTLGLEGAGGFLKMIILSTSTVDINGYILRIQQVKCSDGLVTEFGGEVIEGIGNTTYLFPWVDLSFDGPLRCYEDPYMGTYIHPDYQSTECEKNINYINLNYESPVSVSTNPTTGDIKVTGLQGKSNYELVDIKGLKIKTGQLDDTHNIFQTTNLPKGLYLLRLHNNQLNVVKKLILN